MVIYNQMYAKHSFFSPAENTWETVDKYRYLCLWCSNNKIYLEKSGRKISQNNIHNYKKNSHHLGHHTPKYEYE